jgi:LmbE family N-acetylglucosaminyl deacetylase
MRKKEREMGLGRRQTITRKAFLLHVAGAAIAFPLQAQQDRPPKALIVAAHPDDEYSCSATVFAITQKLHGIVDHVVITNGEAGFRYSTLAERIYGLKLTNEEIGRRELPAIRREETKRAGRILGVRRHYFLEQKDTGLSKNLQEALAGAWDIQAVEKRLVQILEAELYDFVLILLPTEETHGNHQAASLLALRAIQALPAAKRPVALGAAASDGESRTVFKGRAEFPETKVIQDTAVFSFARTKQLGPSPVMTYHIIVNWMIAEYKSQGTYQGLYGKHSHENFWTFANGAPDALAKAKQLSTSLEAATRNS